MNRRIRMGMVGGGEGAFIGAVHRLAANLDGQIELVCGCFSRDPGNNASTGKALFLAPDRVYENFEQMMAAEAALPADRRMDLVSIVTPNVTHYPVAAAALKHGFHVISDKPATLTLDEAKRLAQLLRETGLLYALTHTYTGYPMVKEARVRIARGDLGPIRKVLVEYPQGWLSAEPTMDNKQASWRLDPAQSGLSACVADIGVHAANLAEYICGDRIAQVSANLLSVVEGRALDDDASVLLRFRSGATGHLYASQVCSGEENTLKVRVYGERGGLSWQHDESNSLRILSGDTPELNIRTGGPDNSALALANTRTPAGHPEGYLEAFANIYRNFAAQIRSHTAGQMPNDVTSDVPGIDDALSGMAFIEACVASSRAGAAWQSVCRNEDQGEP